MAVSWDLVLYLHLVAMAFFLGGQLLVAISVPALRRDPELLRAVARRFGWKERKNRLPKIVADRVGAGHRRAYPAGHADRKGLLPLSGSLK